MKNFHAFSVGVFFTALSLMAGFYLGRYTDWVMTNKKKVIQVFYSDKEQKIKRLLSLIEIKYIKEVNTDRIIDETIQHIISQLDTHSAYIPKEKFDKACEFLKGEHMGFGMEYRLIHDTPLITRVLKESVNKNILTPGDRMLKINDQKITGKSPHEIKEFFNKGNSNTVAVTLLKNKSLVDVLIKKQKIITPTIEAAYMLNDHIGYIKLSRFGKHSLEEFDRALSELKAKDMKDLALDLRNNPGGWLDIAKNITDEFLEKGQLITFTKEKSGNSQYYYASGNGRFKKGKLYILINEKSASSSEVLAGAVQDHQRGLIIEGPHQERPLFKKKSTSEMALYCV